VLAGVLLDVIKTTSGIHCAMYRSSGSKRLAGKMQDAPVFVVGDLNNRDLPSIGNKRAKIVHLAAAGGIERSSIKHNRVLPIARKRFDHAGIEVVEKRVVVIEAFSHGVQVQMQVSALC
jgi:hypothetical protein